MNKKVLATFDYSITSPAMTLWDGSRYRSWVVSSEKKIYLFENDLFTIQPIAYPFWKTPQERYESISDLLMKHLLLEGPFVFGIESYSMGSKGRVFDIAEATQTLKYKIWKMYGQEMNLFAPTTVKKDFSGKGNSNKDKMAEAFYERFGFWMHDAVGSKIKGSASDIVDSIAVNISLQKARSTG